VSREATQKDFVPIGHISLDSRNPGVERVGVASSAPGLFWIKTFFVSGKFQSKGIGRAAMDEVESMAVREPLCATMLMLDVIPGEDQMREEFALATYGSVPKVRFTKFSCRDASFFTLTHLFSLLLRSGTSAGDIRPSRLCRTFMMWLIAMESLGI
jgi:hypothetical protein